MDDDRPCFIENWNLKVKAVHPIRKTRGHEKKERELQEFESFQLRTILEHLS